MEEPKPKWRLTGPLPTGPDAPTVKIIGDTVFIRYPKVMLDEPRPATPIPGRRRKTARVGAKPLRRTKKK